MDVSNLVRGIYSLTQKDVQDGIGQGYRLIINSRPEGEIETIGSSGVYVYCRDEADAKALAQLPGWQKIESLDGYQGFFLTAHATENMAAQIMMRLPGLNASYNELTPKNLFSISAIV